MCIAAAEFAYARTNRLGSRMRFSSTGSSELTMSPRYEGRPSASSSDERGLAYWPATRPTLTTGTLAPYVRTTAICSSVRVVLCRCGSVLRSKVSEQSPPWSRNALPCATSASRVRRSSTSVGATIGGTVESVARTASSAARSGHRGCWAAGRSRHRSSPGSSSGRLTCRGYGDRPSAPEHGDRRHRGLAEEDLHLGVALHRDQLELR